MCGNAPYSFNKIPQEMNTPPGEIKASCGRAMSGKHEVRKQRAGSRTAHYLGAALPMIGWSRAVQATGGFRITMRGEADEITRPRQPGEYRLRGERRR